MDNATYATLTRQSGLKAEMQAIAHNIANVSTDGFRREGVIFAEHVERMETADASLSMAAAHGRTIDTRQGQLVETGGRFDFAIEGEGFFQLETADGVRLTRAGRFMPDATGTLVAADGARLLDAGGAPVVVPPGAGSFRLAADGTLSADGQPLARLGVVMPVDRTGLSRAAGVRFLAEGGVRAVETPRLAQGFVEASNVDPVIEIARMIEVQRAYERGRRLIGSEDERIRNVIQTLGR